MGFSECSTSVLQCSCLVCSKLVILMWIITFKMIFFFSYSFLEEIDPLQPSSFLWFFVSFFGAGDTCRIQMRLFRKGNIHTHLLSQCWCLADFYSDLDLCAVSSGYLTKCWYSCGEDKALKIQTIHLYFLSLLMLPGCDDPKRDHV